MNWKTILPKDINVRELSLEDRRNFKNLHSLMRSINEDVIGPPGYRVFYQLMHYLLMYAITCMEEEKFPALNKCWDALSPLFLTPEYDCEWLVYCWMFCDFPLSPKNNDVLLDHFVTFLKEQEQEQAQSNPLHEHLGSFLSIMKASRLGLYQEVLSTSKVTKYKELFTKKPISTVRSVPYYESGEIFLTRIVSYLGDSFSIHDSKSYPADLKEMVEGMVLNKMCLISSTKNVIADYEFFMKLAGPYWMSCMHPDPSTDILSPDEYKNYY